MNSQDRRALEECALFERLARQGDSRDREALVERYLPLARSLALRYQRSGEPFDDLLQVASLGLIKAIDGFDPHRGIAFGAYAVPTILGEIKRYFRDRTWAVHVPSHLQDLTLRVDRAVSELAERLHRQPSVAEIVVAVGADEEAVLEALQAGGAYRARSFDEPSSGGDDAAPTLGESLGVAEHGFARVEARVTFTALLGVVTTREREVLRMRFEEDMTQAEIAAAIGASQMHVSRIIRAALGRIRRAMTW
ncbi:MAG: polymerase sigma-B factor [Solirubrobacteraceae bacterium]|jgi:RNA polymerase sigma-B factor|nr:polymerase sigma-B factor [Solirubrobacteraceae bacterium]MEA2240457.1 polymerase sigma-B factor [Solirubrobacteraceae bacterium]